MSKPTSSMLARRSISSRLLIALFWLILASGSYGSPIVSRKGGKSSVFSLFNLKQKSKFWSESVIREDFDDLESSVSSNSGKMGLLNYTMAGNIASYLRLSEVDSIYLPVPVNFIFIGFEGKGNHDFKLGSEELERWFTKIDHIFEHTRIPQIGEALTPFYKISIDKSEHHHLPLVSHVNYNFSVHAIQMGEKVTSVFERAIEVSSHRDDSSDNRENEGALWQVDMDQMEFIFTSLINYLGLENVYNIFILNPKNVTGRSKYGYRRGLSESEIQFLKENKDLQTKILQSEGLSHVPLDINKGKRPLHSKHPMTKFAWTMAEDIDTVEWSNMCLNALGVVEQLYHGNDTAEIIYNKAKQILHGRNEDMKLHLKKELKTGKLAGLHAECLTDTWIGRDRPFFLGSSCGWRRGAHRP